VADTLAKRIGTTSKAIIMIRNGLYSVISKLLDGVEGGATGVGNLLVVDGKVIGAIGVSGGSGSQDNVVSLTGQAALK
jgi:glc operon protein GlcG